MGISAEPLFLTLNAWQGQTLDDTITLENSDGTPVNLTGYTPYMDVRADVTDASPIVTFSPVDGTLTVSDAVNGVLAFNVPESQLRGLSSSNEPQSWVYDIRLITTAGYSVQPVQGMFLLNPTVTRSQP